MDIIEVAYKWNGTLSPRTKTRFIVLHHEAMSVAGPEEIHRIHQNQGWAGIGYHFLVRKDGKVYRGRPMNTIGAHARNYNDESIGICAEGNFMTDVMSDAQKNSIIELIKYLKTIYKDAKVVGHKELNATACPGLKYPLEEIKTKSTQKITITPAPTPTKMRKEIKVTTPVLNCRKGPGTQYAVLKKYVMGNKLTAIDLVDGWYKLDVNGVPGYVKATYTKEI